ncbi:MAG TPA: hypothetical protein VG755_38280 [Nannocystaceae bacterium]|nr:hypothetical protein [Nannocystaceae bacterium]
MLSLVAVAPVLAPPVLAESLIPLAEGNVGGSIAHAPTSARTQP